MTEQLVKVLAEDMDEAVKSQDTGRIMSVMARQSNAMMDCQLKMSERVKTLAEWRYGVDRQTAQIEELSAKVEALEDWRISIENQYKGAQRVTKLLYAVYGAGGSAAVVALIKWLSTGVA